MILDGGYSCSNVVHSMNLPFSSSSIMISTLFAVSSMNEPIASLMFFSGLLLKLIPYIGHFPS
jgi:hypothetical protein